MRAVMTVLPSATPVTTPFASTAATVGLRLDQATRRPVTLLPASSRSSITNVSVFPSRTESTGYIPLIDATFGGSVASLQAVSTGIDASANAPAVRSARRVRRTKRKSSAES